MFHVLSNKQKRSLTSWVVAICGNFSILTCIVLVYIGIFAHNKNN
nr:MAG TPA_asm: hypothetical protein [Caudoviricetes sp.]DAP34368.1 MAG TPA: hypothetical protein [Caudoviricetes sp.]